MNNGSSLKARTWCMAVVLAAFAVGCGNGDEIFGGSGVAPGAWRRRTIAAACPQAKRHGRALEGPLANHLRVQYACGEHTENDLHTLSLA